MVLVITFQKIKLLDHCTVFFIVLYRIVSFFGTCCTVLYIFCQEDFALVQVWRRYFTNTKRISIHKLKYLILFNFKIFKKNFFYEYPVLFIVYYCINSILINSAQLSILLQLWLYYNTFIFAYISILSKVFQCT